MKTVGPGARRDRGVSDVVAFTFVFAIIITSVGVVSAVGFTALNDLQESEQALNAERAFQALGNNFANIQRGHAPGRTGEIKLSDGTIRILDREDDAGFADRGSKIRVQVGSGTFDEEYRTGTMTYRVEGTGAQNTTIGYEAGAVFRRDRQSSILVEGPRLICRNPSDAPKYAIVSVIIMDANKSQPAKQGGNVQIQARENSSALVYANTDTSTTQTVSVTIQRSQFNSGSGNSGWAQFFESDDNAWSWSSSDSKGTCKDVKRVYVRKNVLLVDIIG